MHESPKYAENRNAVIRFCPFVRPTRILGQDAMTLIPRAGGFWFG